MIKRIKELIKNFLIKLISIFKEKTNETYRVLELDIEKEFGGGLLWIWEKETDYVFWNSEDIKEKLRERWVINRQVEYEYNQWAEYETRNYCTVFSAVTELSWLFDRRFTVCEIKEIANRMIKDWKLDPDKWAYLSDAIDYSRRWWNEMFPDNQVESYRIDYSDKELNNILTHKYPRLTQLWYRTSGELYKDLQDDWIASKADYPRSWWHAVSKWGYWIIDNYKGQKTYNRYTFQFFNELVDNWIIFKYWYIFLKRK